MCLTQGNGERRLHTSWAVLGQSSLVGLVCDSKQREKGKAGLPGGCGTILSSNPGLAVAVPSVLWCWQQALSKAPLHGENLPAQCWKGLNTRGALLPYLCMGRFLFNCN